MKQFFIEPNSNHWPYPALAETHFSVTDVDWLDKRRPTWEQFNDRLETVLWQLDIIPHICHFFTRAKFLENKIYTKKTRKLRQNTQKIANFLRYYGKIHSKLPIFRVKSVKIYTGQKKFTRTCSWGSWQISGMSTSCSPHEPLPPTGRRGWATNSRSHS